MGSKLISVSSSGEIETIGDVGNDGKFVTMDYSFDRLSISSNGNLFYYDKSSLVQVADVDLGAVYDHIFIDGYFMTTDGEFIVVTELNDPTSVLSTKYGSSEIDPDPIKSILKLRNEPYVLNRYTVEVFDNVGGSGFPFSRVDGAQIMRGTVGTHTCCVFDAAIAFVGGGRNESVSVWLAASGQIQRIATREIDQILSEYNEDTLSKILVESRIDEGHKYLYIHLPDKTMVYDSAASQLAGEPVWFELVSSLDDAGVYRARNIVFCYNRWEVADASSNQIGYLTNDTDRHWGDRIKWQFTTPITYNDGRGAIFHELELVALTGRNDLGTTTSISTEHTADGQNWSMIKSIRAGKQGNRSRRLVWIGQGAMRNWRAQRFSGTSDSRLSFARLEARIEPLSL